MTPPLKPAWIDTGTHTFELTRQKTGDNASDHEIATPTLEIDWDSYDTTIYTDGAATHCSRIIVATGPPSHPRVHRQCTIPADKWCSSFQAEEKAVRTNLKLVQDDVSVHRVCIVSDTFILIVSTHAISASIPASSKLR